MKRSLFTLASVFIIASYAAQPFAGTIEFRYATQNDTTLNVYSVKDKMVKLDQYSKKKDKTIEGSFLFDLSANEVKFLNPKRKLWGRQKSETPQVISGNCIVIKGKGTMTIAGYKCNEYTVKNSDENTIVTYWITKDKFNFFIPLLKLWNRKDKQSIYFGQLKDLPEGSMPLMSEEKQLDSGKLVTKLEVIKINKTAPADETFMIPKDYSKFDQ